MPEPGAETSPTGFLAWAAEIQQMADGVRRSPAYRRQVDWYRAYHNVDIEQLLSRPGAFEVFRAGMLYDQCERACAERPHEPA
jgi:hypothetical protein